MNDLVKKLLKGYSKELRNHALEADRNQRPPEIILNDPHFKPLQIYKTPPKYWDGFKLENGEKWYGNKSIDSVVFTEEICYGDPTLYLSLPGPSLAGTLVETLGSVEQQDTFFEYFIKNVEWSAFCLTEPSTGTDATSIQTNIKKTSKGYILNGHKRFIANGSAAKWFLVFAKTVNSTTASATNAVHIEALMVYHPKHNENLYAFPDQMMGQRAARLSQIHFNDLKLTDENILGNHLPPLKRGFRGCLKTLINIRPTTAAMAIGTARAVIDYLKENLTLDPNEEILLSKMEWDLQRARLIAYKAAYDVDHGDYSPKYSSMSKQYACRLLTNVTKEGTRIAGSQIGDHPLLEKWMRDARLIEFMSGSSNVHRREVGNHIRLSSATL